VDNLTHTLFGWTVARTGIDRRVPYAAATLIIASNAPDLDILTAVTGGQIGYLAAHRGPTHGPLGFLLLGLAAGLAVLAWATWRRRLPEDRHVGPWLLQLCLVGVLGTTLHALMDLPTSYGTRLLSPFLGTWYAFDWMPIVDVYLLVALVGSLAMARRSGERARWARIGLLLLAVDYTGRALLHERALAMAAERTADGNVSPCATSPTLVRHPAVIEARYAGPGACIQAAALPTFVSPFAWRVIRQYPSGYELSDRSVLAADQAVPPSWMPADTGPEIARARATITGRTFLDFSRFPSSHVAERNADGVVVRFVDVRFAAMGEHLQADPRARSPFVVTVALDASGRVVREQLGN
jgi:membrane-bound metal-dependent hydrolase YbcI (DUF457 family)